MTLHDIIAIYLTDPDSPYHKLRYASKIGYTRLLGRLRDDMGTADLATLRSRDILRQHEAWTKGGKHIAMAHGLITQLRIVINFGASIVEDPDCQRLNGVLKGLRFKNGGARQVWLTPEQARDIRDEACEEHHCRFSIALAQAFQADCAFRQGDVIGRWEPKVEGAQIVDGDMMWVGGLTREQIDADMILTHKTSKRGKVLTFDLKKCPSVMEEWFSAPASGPLIIDPDTGLPFHAWKYRRVWREMARLVEVPDNVWNMDSRAGRITDLFAKDVNPDDIRKVAGHSQLSTTMLYSRGANEAINRALDAGKDDQ